MCQKILLFIPSKHNPFLFGCPEQQTHSHIHLEGEGIIRDGIWGWDMRGEEEGEGREGDREVEEEKGKG